MATRTISNAGGAWNTTGAWVEAQVPTNADDVVATATSGNVSIPTGATMVCRSADFTSYVGTLTWASTTAVLSIGGSTAGPGNVALKMVAGMTVTLTGIGTLSFVSTSATQQTIDTAGKTVPNVTINGAGSSYLLLSAPTGTGAFTVTAGTFNSANYAMQFASMVSNGSSTRTLTLGSSAITLTGANQVFTQQSATGLTITANTATVTMSGANATAYLSMSWNGASLSFTGSGTSFLQSWAGNVTLAGLTRTGTAVKTDGFTVNASGGTITVSGTLTITGNSLTNRVLVTSGTVGTGYTITAAAVSLSNVDFMDITGAGAAAPWTGTSIGDCGGISGITATTPVTRYGVVAGNWSNTATWSTSSGGSGGASVPLPQDTVILDASSAAGTYSVDMPRIGKDVICTGFVRTLNSSMGTTGFSLYGSLTLASGMTWTTASGPYQFRGRGTHTITTAGKTMADGGYAHSIQAPGGTYTLQDAWTGSTSCYISVFAGSFDSAGYAMSVFNFASTGTLTRAVTLGTSTITLNHTTANSGVTFSGSNMTVSAASATFVYSAASATTRTFAGGGHTFGTLQYNVTASSGVLVISGSNTFSALIVGTNRTLRLTSGTTTTVTTAAGLDGLTGTAGNLVTIDATTAGVPALISVASGTVSIDYVSLKDNTATGGAAFYAGANSTNVSGNTGWTFTGPPSAFTPIVVMM